MPGITYVACLALLAVIPAVAAQQQHADAARLLHDQWASDASTRQCFPFSLHQSVARDDFEYPDARTGERRVAKKGELINLTCDGVVCPNLPVPDCYMAEDICGPDEWCQLEDQVRFGPWGMTDNGETPNVSPGDCRYFKELGYDWIYEQVCRNTSHWGPWVTVRGRCSKYRQEQQSCNAYFTSAMPHAAAVPHAAAAAAGGSNDRSDASHHQPLRQQQQQQQQRRRHTRQPAAAAAGAVDGDALGINWDSDVAAAVTSQRRQLLMPMESFHAPGGYTNNNRLKAPSTTTAATASAQQQGAAAAAAAAGGSGSGGSGGEGLLSQLWPQYVVDGEDGMPPIRPQLCGPGLVCTGTVEPLPNTCVKVRPPNICYQGPWWDSSSWCKVGSKASNRYYGGLPQPELTQVAQALLIQLPVEHYVGPTNPKFWQSPSADVARAKIQGIVQALWPEAYRAATKFPLKIPDPRLAGAPLSAEWNTTASEALVLYRQSNKVWSTIQTLIHNCKHPMPFAQVQASRALAVWLRQHFMCCNCRGMWANYVLNRVGLPPKSTSRQEHTHWWWRAQNMVSEHAANSRGGHPWVWPSMADQEFAAFGRQWGSGGHLQCQNPWFLPEEFAELMWKIPDK